MTSIRVVLGNRVRCLRVSLGLSQEGLADAAGLHRTYVGGVERGERNATIEVVAQLAQALGVVPSDLLRVVSEKPASRARGNR
jgi:transcriptional regulator with XRE-family HTH domain